MKELEPDILRLIVDQAVGDINTKDAKEKAKQQELLAKFMQVKALYAICAPLLYRHCQTQNPVRLLDPTTSPDKPDLIAQIKSLRVYASNHFVDPPMVDLLRGRARWEIYGAMRFPHDNEKLSYQRRFAAGMSHGLMEPLTSRIQNETSTGESTLPLLKTVSMGGYGDSTFGCLRPDYAIAKAIPHDRLSLALLSLPTVEHYCQHMSMGPLAVAEEIFKPLNPPKTVTFHYAFPETEFSEVLLPPIILGATNRFIYCSPLRFGTSRPLTPSELVESSKSILGLIGAFLSTRQRVTEEVKPGTPVGSSGDIPGTNKIPFDQVSLDGTYIEIYNQIRNVEAKGTAPAPRDEPGWPFSPEAYKAMEKEGDKLWGRWKGRVKIRNREDIPACPVCGFDGHRHETVKLKWKEAGLGCDSAVPILMSFPQT